MIRRPVCAVLVLLAFILAGCGGGGPDPISAKPNNLRAVQLLPNGLTASLSQETAIVPVLSGATYTVTLFNTTNAPITVTAVRNLATGQVVPQVTLRITDASGTLLLQVSRQQGRLTSVYQATQITLAPGQSISQAHSFSALFIRPGRHAASATFVSCPDASATPVGPLTTVAR